MGLLSWVLSFGLMSAAGSVFNFDHASVGKTPPEWTVPSVNGTPPRWEIRKDPSAPTSPYVLAQVPTNARQDEFSLAILNSMSLRDGDISVRLKPVSGHEDQGGGLVFRYRDPRNYYLVRADAHDGEITVYKMENGRCSPIRPRGVANSSPFAIKHNIQPNTWNILKVSVRGSRFQVYVNHRRLLQADDTSFSGPGKVGLVTVADSVTYFDDFRVNAK
ncbi:MAG TPA: hypothetical protein VKT49_07580 [Bryobacteraceae bacterium]|nr:hypothetical protein [Bryobacteraceae bacterium]